MYFNEEEDSGKEESELGYKEDDDDDDDNKVDEDEEEEWWNISDSKFAPYPVLPLDISPLIWEDRDVISNNVYCVCLPPNGMESPVFYCKGMWYHVAQVIGDVLLHSTLPYD